MLKRTSPNNFLQFQDCFTDADVISDPAHETIGDSGGPQERLHLRVAELFVVEEGRVRVDVGVGALVDDQGSVLYLKSGLPK